MFNSEIIKGNNNVIKGNLINMHANNVGVKQAGLGPVSFILAHDCKGIPTDIHEAN